MFVTIEIQHAIQDGKEKEAMQVLKDLYSNGLDYPGGTVAARGLLIAESGAGMDVSDTYRDHLGRVISQVRKVASPQARIKVRLTT